MQFPLPQYTTLDTHIIVAVSGGVDSVVLAVWLQALGFEISIAHCNFQLRGEESEADEVFVRSLAANINMPFHYKRMNTEVAMQDWKVGIQEAARRLRYDWFTELLNSQYISNKKNIILATAHHQDDSIETFLHHALRGTGLRGLRGVPQVNGRIVRPLLAYSKTDILAYANEKNLAWRDDSSNFKTDYTRNKIRHLVVPTLTAIRTDYREQLQVTMTNLSDAQAVLDELSLTLKTTAVSAENDKMLIRLSKIAHFSMQTQIFLLIDWLQEFGFHRSQCSDMIAAANTNGKQFLTETAYCILHNHTLIIQKNPTKSGLQKKRFYINKLVFDSIINTDFGNILVRKTAINAAFANTSKDIVFLDAQKLALPLYIDTWQIEDCVASFQPLGMKGKKKKISDFLHDLGLNTLEKAKIQLLFDANGEIIWIMGFRADHRYRITENTTDTISIAIMD